MAYFSSKSTWLSLVDASDPAVLSGDAPGADSSSEGARGTEAKDGDARITGAAESPFQHVADGAPLDFQDYRPCFEPTDSNGSPIPPETMTAEDIDYLRITRDLRHRLFFHFKEWEFGPALLEDHLRLAQAQSDPEEALAEYCRARHVAVTLVERWEQERFLLAWIEADRVIAEIHQLIGNDESCEMYAKEGLDRIKRNRFGSDLDMRITRLTVRFFNLLGRR